MSFANKHNVRKFNFTVPETFEHVDLKALFDANGEEYIYKVNAIYINSKGKFGDQPIVATDNELVNFPHHTMENVKEILDDQMSVTMINDGLVGFSIYQYENDFGVNYSPVWVDLVTE